MKISDLISELEQIQATAGDLDIIRDVSGYSDYEPYSPLLSTARGEYVSSSPHIRHIQISEFTSIDPDYLIISS